MGIHGESGDKVCALGRGECANPDAVQNTTTVGRTTSMEEEDPKCPSHELIIRCTAKHLDYNSNGKLERSELQSTINKLPWFSKGILRLFGSVDYIMQKCDVDGDDAISMDYDMIHNKDRCWESCLLRKAFRNWYFPDCD